MGSTFKTFLRNETIIRQQSERDYSFPPVCFLSIESMGDKVETDTGGRTVCIHPAPTV